MSVKNSYLLVMLMALGWAWMPGSASAKQPVEGFALEMQGMQSRYNAIAAPEDWQTDNQFNEAGFALRWQWQNSWLAEGRVSRGSELRYLLELETDEDGETEYDTRKGRTYAWSLAAGKRFWVNEYFSWVPTIGYMQRGIRSPELPTGEGSSRSVEHSATLGIKAEYRVLRRMSVSLNFYALSSGERQQGLAVAYYFF